ncbi:hypothetical protein EII14_06380 [Alloprevotella sp. OH1205_COT-284]|uniref:tetratricopeptide repeat protein n=1 Tax=Alloprevotella sp. OH1205_COT-284 TaxID=2491043 RepID=UPI000F5E6674|nr:tetratricopeptide repeat protein [Alloprevotella sp. OH1205_COT-284]RRD79339.1 hypothetical protein EII14_06380 [Alloprevotella sp. OH1205_COT-284]
MKREPNEVKHLVRQYEQKLSEASVPLWMDAPDILDILDHYEQNNQYFEAEECMRLALRLHPDNPEVQIRRAYRLKNEGRWQEAVQVVESISEQDCLDVCFFWGEKALSELDFERAESFFNQGLRIERDIDAQLPLDGEEEPMGVSDLLLEMGELFIDYGSIARAQKYLQQITSSEPEYNRAQILLAECAFQLGDTPSAVSLLEKVLDNDPYDLDAWIMLADVSNESKNFEKCAEASNFALAIDPKNEKALRFKAVAALGLEKYDEVLEVYDNYRLLYPTDYTMALSAGEILINQRKMLEARKVLSRSNQACPNEHPDKVRILGDIATTYAAEGDFRRAHDTLLGCCSLGTSYADVLLQTAQLCFNYGEQDFGKKALLHYLSTYTLTAETRQRMAQILCEANLFETMSEIWDTLLKVTENGTTLAAPYLAFAARRLRRIPEYMFWLAYSIYEDPTRTQQFFRQIYPDRLPSEYLAQARLEFPEE